MVLTRSIKGLSILLSVFALGGCNLNVSIENNIGGTVSSNDGLINCPGICSHEYDNNAQVTLQANADEGYDFLGYKAPNLCENVNQPSYLEGVCTLTMSSHVNLIAMFVETNSPELPSVLIEENETGYCTNNSTVENEHLGFSGDGYTNVDNMPGERIEWKINGEPGEYEFTFRYANADDMRTGALWVNDKEVATNIPFVTTGSWASWSTVKNLVTLTEPPENIQLVGVGQNGLANVDYVEIKGPNVEAQPCDNNPSNRLIGFAAQNGGTTGGQGGNTVTVSTTNQFLSAISESDPLIVQVDDTIFLSGMHKVRSNKTIMGVGSKGVISGGGLNLDNVSNIIIRNLKFVDSNDDAINLQYSNNVWIDHCDFSNAHDGLIDIKRGSDFVTVSWNHFSNHNKTCLLGSSDEHGDIDTGHLRVTYHHNWFDHTNGRHPRVRFSKLTHVFNNYYEGNSYGVASTMNAQVLVENNYFNNVDQPTVVGYGSSGEGDLVERGNRFVSSGFPETKNSVPEPTYQYELRDVADIPSLVRSRAGRAGF